MPIASPQLVRCFKVRQAASAARRGTFRMTASVRDIADHYAPEPEPQHHDSDVILNENPVRLYARHRGQVRSRNGGSAVQRLDASSNSRCISTLCMGTLQMTSDRPYRATIDGAVRRPNRDRRIRRCGICQIPPATKIV
jgi:hypothetical protein